MDAEIFMVYWKFCFKSACPVNLPFRLDRTPWKILTYNERIFDRTPWKILTYNERIIEFCGWHFWILMRKLLTKKYEGIHYPGSTHDQKRKIYYLLSVFIKTIRKFSAVPAREEWKKNKKYVYLKTTQSLLDKRYYQNCTFLDVMIPF